MDHETGLRWQKALMLADRLDALTGDGPERFSVSFWASMSDEVWDALAKNAEVLPPSTLTRALVASILESREQAAAEAAEPDFDPFEGING